MGATLTTCIDRGGRRIRTYVRTDTTRPGQQLRRRMAELGRSWCRGCQAWLPTAQVSQKGACRPHLNAEDRDRYATDPAFRIRAIAKAQRRKRGVDSVPIEATVHLRELFGSACIYCGEPADTWDHFRPVADGGRTEPGNIVPACGSCNSAKNARDPWTWSPPAPTDGYETAFALALELGVL